MAIRRIDAGARRRDRAPRTLVIFDVDGTLTRTNDVDTRCLVRAVRLELGLRSPDTDWSSYAHTTDSGIVRELVRRARTRSASADEVGRVRDRQTRLLAAAFARAPIAFRAVPGAATLLARLRRAPRWAAALATGAWQPSALVKLAGARLDVGELPIASADDGVARERIVRIARRRAERAYGGLFTRVVLVGDAPWDARTASRLQLPMVGIAAKGAEARLRAHGVTRVVHDFRDVAAVLHALRTAAVPRVFRGVSA